MAPTVPQSTSLYSQAERLDLNKDDELNLDEVKRLKALGGEIDELLKFDTNGDGLLDSGEIQALKEVSQAKSKLEILKHVESCLTEINDRKGNYFNMFSFIMFVCFYFAILMLQREAFLAYDVTFALSETAVPKDSNRNHATSFTSAEKIYTWLEKLVGDVWVDPQCGDGICESPYEYPGFGITRESFGCPADCGVNPSTSVIIFTVMASLWQEADTATVSRFASETQWNLCTQRAGLESGQYSLGSLTLDLFPLGADGLRYTDDSQAGNILCWFPTWQQLNGKQLVTHELNLLNADWKLLVDAPVGGIAMEMVNASSGEVLASLDYCQPACSSEDGCAAGMYCSRGPPSLAVSSRFCVTCPAGGEACPDDSDDCNVVCRQGGMEAGSSGNASHAHPNSTRGLAREWETLSVHYYCLPFGTWSFENVETVDECKARCEQTEGCLRVNMYLDVVEDLLWCLGSADECPATDEPLHTAEEMNTLAFQLRKEVIQYPVVADLEASYIQAHAATPCNAEEPRAMLLLDVR
ncbi:hypothetical protein CYMTET_46504 [Cymbomonas tetramitiformis]|uniref:EF-hand domain-containing protein n=1 Tax=Cymbomonas tetramitiformis TaxID=36881 RepID=A0AAE0EXJ5_9CHLO|nr:hypothetical protein CYMTET_46504 [Cymbomonas tetramitiformis]